jgi:thioesterase domain-containing protein/acyl carrier protein
MSHDPLTATLLSTGRPLAGRLVEKELIAIWCKALECDAVGPGANFFALGGDSIAAVQILMEIRKAFGLTLPTAVLLESPTIEALARAVRWHADWPPPRSPLVELQPGGSNPPFFCVHGVGGEVLNFLDLARHFAPDQPFFALRAVGSEGGVEPFRRIEDMAAYYVEVIRTVQPRPPYYLGGFSFGGSVALEMAQQLHAQGAKVALMAILDHTPPPLRYRRFLWSPGLPIHLAVNAVGWVKEDIWCVGAGKRLTTLRQKAAFILKQLRRLFQRSSPASGKTDVEDVFGFDRIPDHFRRVLEVDYQALRDYAPRIYPGRVTLFRAQVRPLFRWFGRDLGWGKLAGGGLEIVPIPGNHETILREPRVQVLAQALRRHLRKAQASCGGAGGSDPGGSRAPDSQRPIASRG